MTRQSLPGGLYAITDAQLIPPAELINRVGAAIKGGAGITLSRTRHSADYQ